MGIRSEQLYQQFGEMKDIALPGSENDPALIAK
jgi:hypothetical protein